MVVMKCMYIQVISKTQTEYFVSLGITGVKVSPSTSLPEKFHLRD